VLINGVTPVVIALLWVIFWFLYQCYQTRNQPSYQFFKQQSKTGGAKTSTETFEFNVLHKILTTFFVIVQLWLPQIITSSFSVFMCVNYNGEFYLKRNTAIKCWTSDHV
jgi:hypothetical protein